MSLKHSMSDFPIEVDKACEKLDGQRPQSLAVFCAFALSWLSNRGDVVLSKLRHRNWRVELDGAFMGESAKLSSALANAMNEAAKTLRASEPTTLTPPRADGE